MSDPLDRAIERKRLEIENGLKCSLIGKKVDEAEIARLADEAVRQHLGILSVENVRVVCDETNNLPEDIDARRLNVSIKFEVEMKMRLR